jgi:hypothetical protein
VSLLDQPGALLSVARAIAEVGGNIVDIEILATGDGRVVDDLVIDLPAGDQETLVGAIAGTGAEVLNVRRTVRLSGQRPDLDLLDRIAKQPDDALATLVALTPPIYSATWAVAVAAAEPAATVCASPGAPHPLPAGLPVPVGPLPRRSLVDGLAGRRSEVVGAPWGDYLLYLGRADGPTFLQVELVQLRRVLELAAALTSRLADPVPTR